MKMTWPNKALEPTAVGAFIMRITGNIISRALVPLLAAAVAQLGRWPLEKFVITTTKNRSQLFRLAVCGTLQAVFFLWVYPLGHWMRRDTNVYFCFATLALALLSIVAVLPIISRVSPVVRVLITALLVLALWELISATRVLLYQF